MTSPRWWDGRVRLVVEATRRNGGSTSAYVRREVLERGHAYLPALKERAHLMPPQYRVCMECPGPGVAAEVAA
jgi:hypothetical protein